MSMNTSKRVCEMQGYQLYKYIEKYNFWRDLKLLPAFIVEGSSHQRRGRDSFEKVYWYV